MQSNKKWQVSKYAWWDYAKCKWQIPTQSNDAASRITLLVQGTQVLLVHKKIVMESFTFAQKPQDVRFRIRNACLAVVAKCEDKYRKFKVLFDSREDAVEFVNCTKKYVEATVDQTTSENRSQRPENSATRKDANECSPSGSTIPEILSRIMAQPQPSLPAPHCIPEDYPLESAVRLCLLDPGFPRLVEKIEEVLKNYEC